MTHSNTRVEDLAKMAGVSISTVSRALNDHPLISLKTKKRIWALARENNYPFRSSMPAAPLGSEGSIVVVTPHMQGRPLPLSHPFFLELLASIGAAARQIGRASCRERVCQYVEISGVAVSLKKKTTR